MNLIILGPQASGKGTQAHRLAETYNLIHISTGDMFRDEISHHTQLGEYLEQIIKEGKLVPDKLTNEIVDHRLEREDCKFGFVLDGYPRDLEQAEHLDKLPYRIQAVIDLEVPEEEVIKRISSRRICKECNANFNLLYIKPKEDGKCDECQGELIQRDDDQPDAIRQRLNIYHELTEPLIEFYKKKGIVLEINGNQDIDAVYEEIIMKLHTK